MTEIFFHSNSKRQLLDATETKNFSASHSLFYLGLLNQHLFLFTLNECQMLMIIVVIISRSRNDGLLHEIIKGRIRGKPTTGRRWIQMLHDSANDDGYVTLKSAAEDKER